MIGKKVLEKVDLGREYSKSESKVNYCIHCRASTAADESLSYYNSEVHSQNWWSKLAC